jgi:phage-related protein
MGKIYLGVYYETASKVCPVEVWLDEQSDLIKAKMHKLMGLLERHRENLPPKVLGSLGNGLFEIKPQVDKKWPRIIFFHYEDDQIIYLHGFVKKTNKTPRREIEIAEKRRKDFDRQKEKE